MIHVCWASGKSLCELHLKSSVKLEPENGTWQKNLSEVLRFFAQLIKSFALDPK